MGISGAATATFVVKTVALLGMVNYFYRKDLPIRLRGAELLYITPAISLAKTIFEKGLTVTAISGALCWSLAYSSLGYFFADKIAGIASL